MQQPSLDLMEFVEQQILPRYNSFDRAHNITHAQRVISRALILANRTGADIDMVYVAAAYHDLGLEGPRAIHHLTSGKILLADQRLKRWFSPHQLELMKQAVEDHRASAAHEPRSLYGKIIAEADRDLQPEVVIRRTIQFGLSNYPDKGKDEQWERFMKHMQDKYSRHGYIKLWIQGSENETYLNELRRLIEHSDELHGLFDRLYAEETAVKG